MVLCNDITIVRKSMDKLQRLSYQFSYQSKILTLIFSCWLPPAWTSCLSSSEALRRDSASQYTDCSSCCLLKKIDNHHRVRKYFFRYYNNLIPFFFFFFVFWLLHLRKLVKNDVSFAIYLSKSGEIKRRGADGPDAID